MIGSVDEHGRALLDVQIAAKLRGPYTTVTTWIDTGFDGHLILSNDAIERLGLQPLVDTEAILADGSRVMLSTLVCYIEWFEKPLALQVIATEGRYPLLGTGLLEQRVLHIDFKNRNLTLT